MKRYKYLSINFDGRKGGVNIYCTNPSTINWLYSVVKEYVPNASGRKEVRDLEGKVVFVQLYRLDNQDFEMANWLFRKACEEGWYPLSPYYDGPEDAFMSDTIRRVTFRLIWEEKE